MERSTFCTLVILSPAIFDKSPAIHGEKLMRPHLTS
jgi:hypothetical protein